MSSASPMPLLGSQLIDDPYPLYAQLRAHGPMPLGGALPQVAITRHSHVRAALHDVRMSARRRAGVPNRAGDAEAARMIAAGFDPEERSMLAMDPPDHTRLRGLVSRAFTPRRIDALAGRIQEITDHLLGQVDAGRADLMSALATPLPVIVIAELLGIPAQDHVQLKDWSNALVALIDGTADPARLAAAGAAQRELRAYLADVISVRRREPREDLLSALIAARDERDALSDPELIATCRLLLIAGHETTTNLIGNGLVALLENPDQLALLRAEPALDRCAVEELLRYDGPVQATRRVAAEALEIGGRTLAAGTLVMLVLGAANRDPDVFEEPDRLDLRRDPNPHLAFGHGIHSCLGAVLARLEARIALRSLLTRFPRIELDGAPVRRPTFLLRGFQELPLYLSLH